MKPRIVAKGLTISQELREYAQKRLMFALNRTACRNDFVTLRITDHNGPKGGLDKRCQIHLALPGLPPIVVAKMDADIGVAIDRAVQCAAFAAERLLERAKLVKHQKFTDFWNKPVLTLCGGANQTLPGVSDTWN